MSYSKCVACLAGVRLLSRDLLATLSNLCDMSSNGQITISGFGNIHPTSFNDHPQIVEVSRQSQSLKVDLMTTL